MADMSARQALLKNCETPGLRPAFFLLVERCLACEADFGGRITSERRCDRGARLGLGHQFVLL
jgi:hypothetical protein